MAAFNLLQACPINFVDGGLTTCKLGTFKFAQVTVDKLTRPDCSHDTMSMRLFLNKLENSLMRYSGYKGQRFGDTLNQLLTVQLFHAPRGRYTGHLRVMEQDNGILRRFVGLCEGVENLDLLLEFRTKEDDQMRVESKCSNPASFRIRPSYSPEVYEIYVRFHFTDLLAKQWDKETVSGKLTLSLILNDDALNLIHRDNLTESWSSVGSKMLESVDSTGDGIIVAKNRKRVRCHKAVLISQNDVFKMMFGKEQDIDVVKMNDMTEGGVRALLAYLYCRDIKDALKCSFITWELVMASEKYKVDGLLESMKDVILNKENDWFDVPAALYLWYFAKKMIASIPENDSGFKEILHKTVSVLRSKPEEELEQCPEFKDMLKSSDIALEMCIFFIKNK